MRTIISGPVDMGILIAAEMLADILPTSFVTNGESEGPALAMLDTTCFPIDPKLGRCGENARDYTLCQNADALISAGGSEHLLQVARMYGLLVHEE